MKSGNELVDQSQARRELAGHVENDELCTL